MASSICERDWAAIRRPSAASSRTRPARSSRTCSFSDRRTGEAYFSPPGDLRAYDVVSGKLVWQFHVVPRPGEFGYDTWPKDAWKYIGGTNTWGELTVDAERGIAYFPTGSPRSTSMAPIATVRTCSQLPARARRAHGQAAVAFPERPPRSLGLRQYFGSAVDHDRAERDERSTWSQWRARPGSSTCSIASRVSRSGRSRNVPCRRKPRCPANSCGRRSRFLRAPPPFARQKYHGRRHQSVPADAAEQREQFKERIAKARNEGLFTPIGFSEVIHMPGNNGGSNFGSTSAHPTDGTVYVISYDIPAIIRLLTPEEAAARGERGGGRGGPGLGVYQAELSGLPWS